MYEQLSLLAVGLLFKDLGLPVVNLNYAVEDEIDIVRNNREKYQQITSLISEDVLELLEETTLENLNSSNVWYGKRGSGIISFDFEDLSIQHDYYKEVVEYVHSDDTEVMKL